MSTKITAPKYPHLIGQNCYAIDNGIVHGGSVSSIFRDEADPAWMYSFLPHAARVDDLPTGRGGLIHVAESDVFLTRADAEAELARRNRPKKTIEVDFVIGDRVRHAFESGYGIGNVYGFDVLRSGVWYRVDWEGYAINQHLACGGEHLVPVEEAS